VEKATAPEPVLEPVQLEVPPVVRDAKPKHARKHGGTAHKSKAAPSDDASLKPFEEGK
jgi:hypothetical protein